MRAPEAATKKATSPATAIAPGLDSSEANGGLGLDPQGRDIPRKLVALTDVTLAATWAIQDLDQQFNGPHGPTWSGIAPKPVHSDVRNALFFDFHVAPIPVLTNATK